jgi:hypothetical protein
VALESGWVFEHQALHRGIQQIAKIIFAAQTNESGNHRKRERFLEQKCSMVHQ